MSVFGALSQFLWNLLISNAFYDALYNILHDFIIFGKQKKEISILSWFDDIILELVN